MATVLPCWLIEGMRNGIASIFSDKWRTAPSHYHTKSCMLAFPVIVLLYLLKDPLRFYFLTWEYMDIYILHIYALFIHAQTSVIVQPRQTTSLRSIMNGSALYGTPPATENDLWIVKGVYRFLGLTGKIDPKKGLPLRAKKPPNYVFESWGDYAIRTSIALIVLMVLITGSRLVLRATRRDLRWGLDDWVIIPAAVSCFWRFVMAILQILSFTSLAWRNFVGSSNYSHGHTRRNWQAPVGCYIWRIQLVSEG